MSEFSKALYNLLRDVCEGRTCSPQTVLMFNCSFYRWFLFQRGVEDVLAVLKHVDVKMWNSVAEMKPGMKDLNMGFLAA